MTSSGTGLDYGSGEIVHFVRFLLLGPASRSKKLREFLPQYSEAARGYAVAREKEREKEFKRLAKGAPESEPEPQTEEEEEEAFRKRREARRDWQKEENEELKKIFDLAFSSWSEPHWKKLEAMYSAFAQKR